MEGTPEDRSCAVAGSTLEEGGDENEGAKGEEDELAALPRVDWQRTMQQCQGDDEFLKLVLAKFHNQVIERLQEMEEALHSDGAPPKVRRLAHSVKSTAATLFCLQVKLAAERLQLSCDECMTGSEVDLDLDSGIRELRCAFDGLAEELQRRRIL